MSKLAKTLRVAAKAKAHARVAKAVRARKSLLPELHEAHAAMRKVKVREEGGKVDGAKADARTDRKPRAKKADGGFLTRMRRAIYGEPPALSDEDVAAMTAKPGLASQVADAYMPNIAGVTRLAGAARGLARARAGAPPASPVAEPMGNRPIPPGRMMDATEVVPRSAPMSPATAALTLGTAAALSGMGGADEGRVIPSRPERRPAPDMTVSAPRPAARPVPRETLNADRLNELSMAQSRVGPPSAAEIPRGAAEEAAARNMMARRALIENNPTVGGVEGTFKRGGKVKKRK